MTEPAPSQGEGTRTGDRHTPVLLHEMLAALCPQDGATYIDATFGAGGYSTAILDAAGCNVLALDRDVSAVRAADAVTARYPNRLTVAAAPFSRLAEVVGVYLSTDAAPGQPSVFTPPDGIVLDIGVSSMQLDEAERGFSFMADGPLDMRMAREGPSAADVIAGLEEADLAEILWLYGEEKRSRAIARAIVRRREERPIERTGDLAALVERVLGRSREPGRHPATRTFQGLRIFVNDELNELWQALLAAEAILPEGGRLVVVTFHSLEDRIVKSFLKERTGREGRGSRHLPEDVRRAAAAPSFQFVNQRPLSPSEEEVRANPRARSARLRAAVRTGAPAWAVGEAQAGVPSVRARLADLTRRR